MNTIYRIVWNASVGKWVVASEFAKGRKKGGAKAKGLALAVALALPAGGAFAAEDCTTQDGQTGVIDEAGACEAAAPSIAAVAGTSGYAVQDATAFFDAKGGTYGSANASASAGNATAVGASAVASALSATALGSSAKATAQNTVAVGIGSTASGNNSVAVGWASQTAGDSIAIGGVAGALANGSTALGRDAKVQAGANNSTALGIGAVVNQNVTGAVALGSGSVADRANTVSVGSGTVKRQIVNVAAGTVGAGSTDAVNGAQLHGLAGSVAGALGGGASVDAAGLVTAPSYVLGGTTYNNVGSALQGLDGRVSANEQALENLSGGSRFISAFNNTGTAASAAVGPDSLAVGQSAYAAGNGANALGTGARATQNGANAFGRDAQATGNNSTALGLGSRASGQASAALGQGAKAQAQGAAAFGSAAEVGGSATGGTAIGYYSKATASGGTALGHGASVTAANGVALGASSVASRGNAVSVGSASIKRQIVNVAAGTEDADAVNLGQLKGAAGSIADAIGGGAAVNPDGSISAPTYNVGGTTVNSVGDAITNIDGRVTGNTTQIGELTNQFNEFVTNIGDTVVGEVGAVVYDDKAAKDRITLGGAEGTALTNLKDGELSAASTDAVTGAQLFATNERVGVVEGDITTINTNLGDLDARVTVNEGSITEIRNELADGSLGLVRQDADSRAITVAAGTDGTVVDFAGTAGARTLRGVAAGAVSADSTEAVNGAQLFETNARLGAVETGVGELTNQFNEFVTNIGDTVVGEVGAVVYDDKAAKDRITLGGAEGTALTNLKDGELSAASTDAVTGAQLFATNERVGVVEGDITTINTNLGDLDARVTVNEGSITEIRNELADGSLGLVRQDADSRAITVAAGTDGTVVDFAGTAGARTLRGVAAGAVSADSTEAVNGAQLFETNARLGAVETGVGELTNQFNEFVTNIGDTIVGDIGAVVYDDKAAKDRITLGGAEGTALTNLKDGELSAASTDAVTGKQLHATNEKVQENADAIADLDTAVTHIDDRVTNIDGRVTNNTNQLTEISNKLENGSIGLVQQDAATGAITVAAGTGGGVVNVEGTDGARRLTGVANGREDADAATIAQLKAMGLVDPDGNPLAAVAYDDVSLGKVTLGGTGGTVITNLAPGVVGKGSTDAINGGQLYDLQQSLEGKIGDLDNRVGTIEQGIADGSIGGGDGGNGGGDWNNDAGGQPIQNVGNGVKDTDAANVGQLNERLQQAKEYTDSRFNALQSDFDSFRQDVDQRFGEVDKRIDRMSAISAAYAGMAINTAGLPGRNRLGVGIGAQNGKEAMAVGYQRVFGRQGNVSVSIGGAFSGNETSVSAGAGFGW